MNSPAFLPGPRPAQSPACYGEQRPPGEGPGGSLPSPAIPMEAESKRLVAFSLLRHEGATRLRDPTGLPAALVFTGEGLAKPRGFCLFSQRFGSRSGSCSVECGSS